MLQRAKDHHKILHLPEPKRQQGLDGRLLVKKTPEQQYTVKALDKIFKQLKDQRNVPMVFQLTRYLARKGLGPLSEGEPQTLEGYMESNQRRQSLEWIRKLMVQCQKDFEEANDQIYG